MQQIELLFRELDRGAAHHGVALVEIQRHTAAIHETRRFGLVGGLACPAPQQRADARHELADPERLREVVVGAAFEAEDLVRLGVLRGYHEHRRIHVGALRPQRPAEGDAVEARQHHVDDNEVESRRARNLEGPQAIRHLGDLEARQRQMQPDQLADGGFVLDDQGA